VLTRIRKPVGEDIPVGIRICSQEFVDTELIHANTMAISRAMDEHRFVDYINLISDSTTEASDWIHVFPPMTTPPTCLAKDATDIKHNVKVTVLVTGQLGGQARLAQRLPGRKQFSGVAPTCHIS